MQSYIDFVESLAKDKQDKVFFNSGPNHAAIVMSRIFKYSKNEVKIYCGGFTGAVSDDEEYLKYLDSYLTEGGTLKVLVEKDLSKSDNKIFKVLRKHNDKVSMYLAANNIINIKTGDPIHFTIGDKSMLRVETGVNDYTARVNFGNAEAASTFEKLFDEVLSNSKQKQIQLH